MGWNKLAIIARLDQDIGLDLTFVKDKHAFFMETETSIQSRTPMKFCHVFIF